MIHWVMIFRKVLLRGVRWMVIGTRCQCPDGRLDSGTVLEHGCEAIKAADTTDTVPSDLKLLQK